MTRRNDLDAITELDLEQYSNRGTIKRASGEVKENKFTVEWTISDNGDIKARWSDDVSCFLPGNGTLKDGKCTCPSTTTCRHLIRTVLAYQAYNSDTDACGSLHKKTGPWDPGRISDEQIESRFGKQIYQKARNLFDSGLLIELNRGQKPDARIHGLGIYVRFIVENDLRYAHADCEGDLADQAIIISVLAFRLMEQNLISGYVVSGSDRRLLPVALKCEIYSVVWELLTVGISNLSEYFSHKLQILENRCREQEIIWPADIVAEINQEIMRYQKHDSLFDPVEMVDLIGELIIRIDALSSDVNVVPSLVIAGTRYDQIQEIKGRRLISLGADVRLTKKKVVLRSYLNDLESSTIVVYEKETGRTMLSGGNGYSRLADVPIIPNTRFSDFTRSQLLIGSGKRTSSGKISIGRKITLNPQNYDWEKLKGGCYIDEYNELVNHLKILPPSSIRSRRTGGDFFVLSVEKYSNPLFNVSLQEFTVTLEDKAGEKVLLRFSYNENASGGFERMVDCFTGGTKIKYISGTVKATNSGLEIYPVAIITHNESGTDMIQPWLDNAPQNSKDNEKKTISAIDEECGSKPRIVWLSSVQQTLSEMILVGLRHADKQMVTSWKTQYNNAQLIGFTHLAVIANVIFSHLEHKLHTTTWEPELMRTNLFKLFAYVRLAPDVS